MSNPNQDFLHWAHPLVREWFTSQIGSPTEPQQRGWPAILAGQDTLISAPTGSGKTFAAFLACIDHLVRQAVDGQLANETTVLYVSPLKALSNDIQKNLMAPLHEITKLAKANGITMSEIRVAVRTGDTPTRERQAMLRKPPHILVTTPESLYILLTAVKSRELLKNVQTVIVDEIHALVNSKRGTHLSLSLERLAAITHRAPIRIGLSATQKPIEVVARFLVGAQRDLPEIINIGHVRQLELAIETPRSELGPIASNEMWDEIYDRLTELALQNRSTLVFVNTRRLAERVAHHLGERLGEELVASHHGSLSRKLRLAAETKLKNGELKVLVATASLELGIDIGSIDLVCQIGSTRAIAVALQRIGRAGHWHGAISRGRIFVTTRDELVECAALVQAIRAGDLDQLIIPEQPLDILAQQIIATCATGDWREDDLFDLVKRAFSYADLTREQFDTIMEMLAEGIAGSRGRYGAYLFRDRVSGVVKARRGSRLTAITSGGAIPDNALYSVVAEPTNTMVGTLDEDFAVESNRGDIFLLGSTSWRIKRVESSSGRVLVEDAHGAPPTVPFWLGEAPGRTRELSAYVAQLRQQVSDLLPADLRSPVDNIKHSAATPALLWLKENCGLDDSGAEQLVEYIILARTVLGAVPTQKTLIAERFFDEAGGMQLIIHSPFGARINKAWGLALRKRFCRSFNFELQAAATDDGIIISLAEQHSFPLADVFQFLHPNTIEAVLVQAVLDSPLFNTRWRWDASRALALVRFRNGKKVPPPILRMLSDDLLAAVFPDAAACQDNLGGREIELPDHPLINETMKDVLHEALDVAGLVTVLEGINDGSIRCLAVDTPIPSVLSHEILNANPYAFLDDAPLEERRARAVELRRVLPESVLQEVGKLDVAAITEVREQAWPDVVNADELQDVLQTLIAFPEECQQLRHTTGWQEFFNELVVAGRAGVATVADKRYWVSVEKAKTFSIIYPQASLSVLKDIEVTEISREDAIIKMLRGWVQHLGPTTQSQLAELLSLSTSEVEVALLTLEASGLILRGNFTGTTEELEWCERRLLARIHRMTVGRLRKEIAPVTPAEFMRWLLSWQHLGRDTQLRGERGLLEVIKQLQGFEIAANAWERQILAKRVIDYTPDMLDKLCLTGVIGWGKLSAAQASAEQFENVETENTSSKKRTMPTSVAPITFFIREESDWMPQTNPFAEEKNLAGLSHVAKNIFAYLKLRGAAFFADIVRGVGNLKAEVETGLWELVTAGVITADGFDNLRALVDPKRRSGNKGQRLRPRYSAGRWTLLHEYAGGADHQQHVEAACWMLLKRYGVVFRDIIAREKNVPRWRELQIGLRRLEDRGEIRGGRFVSGFLGEQFALPYAVESLRAIRKKVSANERVTFAAVDPLNLVGIILPGPRVMAVSGKQIVLVDGVLLPED
ncbi:MAG: DEAD/DEAH box helicase [Pseudomonadota bacterium]